MSSRAIPIPSTSILTADSSQPEVEEEEDIISPNPEVDEIMEGPEGGDDGYC